MNTDAMKLEQLQQDFIAAIFNTDRTSAVEHVKGDDRLNANQRLNIYRGSVHGILTQSLGETFPVCKQLLGEEFFDKMCDRFIDQYPPSTPFFSHFGNNLALFLSEFEPVNNLPFIPDVAAFEWSRHELWRQKVNDPFDFSQIANLTEEQQARLLFTLSPSLHLFQSEYRIDLIWFAHQDNSDIALEDIDINTEINLLLWKSHNGDDSILKVANYELASKIEGVGFNTKDYWDFLYAVANQKDITELATEFEEKFPELLNKSIQDGWIESFTCD